jgi:hypothetical protein
LRALRLVFIAQGLGILFKIFKAYASHIRVSQKLFYINARQHRSRWENALWTPKASKAVSPTFTSPKRHFKFVFQLLKRFYVTIF